LLAFLLILCTLLLSPQQFLIARAEEANAVLDMTPEAPKQAGVSLDASLEAKTEKQGSTVLILSSPASEPAVTETAKTPVALQAKEADISSDSKAEDKTSAPVARANQAKETASVNEAAALSSSSGKGEFIGNFTITAYCDCVQCQGKWVGQTASGQKPKPGLTIAVDPAVIPLGSSVFIEGVGVRVAQDTGGAIKGQKIDLFFSSYEEAVKWGKRVLPVFKVKNN